MASTLPKMLLSDNILKAIKESKEALRQLKKVDPRTRNVVLFPDSTRAYPNMAFKLLDVAPAEEVYNKASELLKRDYLKICLNSDGEELFENLETRSLAAFITSHATMEKLKHEQPHTIPLFKAAGGIGVGFINSLVFSKAMTFEDGLDLVRRRAKAMDKAAKIVPSAKIQVKVAPNTRLRKVCQAAIEHCLQLKIPPEIAQCSVTAQFSAHILEIGGHEEAIKYLESEGYETFRFRRMKRVQRIPQAYHTQLMQPAYQYIQAYIKHRMSENPDYLKEPETCSVYSGTAGRRTRFLKDIKTDLYDYTVKPILTEQLLHRMFARPDTLAQPNIYVIWDKYLLKNLALVNLRARKAAKLFS